MLVALLTCLPAVSADWLTSYREAVDAIDRRQDVAAARATIERLLDERPYPERESHYLPYLQMARVQLIEGEIAEAEMSLDISEAFEAWDRRERELYASLREKVERQRRGSASR